MTKSTGRWERPHQDLGEVPVKRMSVFFKAIEPLGDVVSVRSSCGCSVPKVHWDSVQVDYSPSPVPYHLRERGWYDTEKRVTVVFRDGSEDVLTFSARVTG